MKKGESRPESFRSCGAPAGAWDFCLVLIAVSFSLVSYSLSFYHQSKGSRPR